MNFISIQSGGFSKYAILLFLFPLICFACNQATDSATPVKDVEPTDLVEGVWQMTHHFYLLEGDTVYVVEDVGSQQKIYLDGYVMWTSDPAPDSSEWHGFGTYELGNDTIREKLLSMSLPMQAAWEPGGEAILTVEYNESSFKQTMDQIWRDTVYQNVEVYKRLK